MKKSCVVLLSGGIDSATTAAIAVNEGFFVQAITFSYGQKHVIEVGFAGRIARFLDIKNHIIIELTPQIFASSALSSSSGIEIPKGRDLTEDDIPVTYVPGRNILFLSYALSCAEASGARDIFIGANSLDYSGYPDCRPEFISAFEQMANAGTKAGVSGDKFRILAPLISMKKSEIIRIGTGLGLDYSLTLSCYDPAESGLSCGRCDSCRIRRKGFEEAGIPDPTKYRD
ncbi:MAG: 7-cyano-7-deazaguanine synthase QueC [Spirochaetes bacterium]|nr:7-cyano-7-deazaguanine synthase QueC [Spirochaetota bacterium]